MDLDEAKQIIESAFAPYESELSPNNENPSTFNLIVHKSEKSTYGYDQLDINAMSKSKFMSLVHDKKKLLQKNCGFTFDES